jgi:hypothetical protein
VLDQYLEVVAPTSHQSFCELLRLITIVESRLIVTAFHAVRTLV